MTAMTKRVKHIDKNVVIGSDLTKVLMVKTRKPGINPSVVLSGRFPSDKRINKPPIRHRAAKIAKLIPGACFQKSRSNKHPRAMTVNHSRLDRNDMPFLLDKIPCRIM